MGFDEGRYLIVRRRACSNRYGLFYPTYLKLSGLITDTTLNATLNAPPQLFFLFTFAKVIKIFEPCKFFVLINLKDIVKLLHNLSLCVSNRTAGQSHNTNTLR